MAMQDGVAIEESDTDDRHIAPSAPDAGIGGTDGEDTATMNLSWAGSIADSNLPRSPTSPTPPTSPTSPRTSTNTTHKRNFSGGILSRLSFLRTSSDSERSTSHERPKSRDKGQTSPTSPPKNRTSEDELAPVSPPSPPKQGESAMAAALKQQKTRKRKGSLRKTALLGGRMGRERKGSFTLRSPTKVTAQPVLTQTAPTPVSAPPFVEEFSSSPYALQDTERAAEQFVEYDAYRAPPSPPPSSSNASSLSVEQTNAGATAARLSLLTDTQAQQTGDNASITSPLDPKSPVSQTSQTSYISTTDEDDILVFDRPTSNNHLLSPPLPIPKPTLANATSYFPAQLPRKRSSKRSPLSHATPITASPYSPIPEPHDYTETSYWGWIILVVTWITFTVGMGSSLGVWSWAWDVGETPYAPPELEDDPTLPIVGYYPALIVLSAVVAWVWVAVAWVGMKYFRHAKIEV